MSPPPVSLINSIKVEFDIKSARKPHTIYYKIAALAAAVVIIALAGTRISLNNTAIQDDIVYVDKSTEIWDAEGFSENDADLALFSAEIENIEMSILTLRLDETENGNGHITDYIDDLETQLIEIETVFWKG